MDFGTFFGTNPPPGTPADAAQKIASSLSEAAKGTPAAPFVDPLAKATSEAVKQVEEATKKSYVESVLSSPAAKIAAGVASFGLVWALLRRR